MLILFKFILVFALSESDVLIISYMISYEYCNDFWFYFEISFECSTLKVFMPLSSWLEFYFDMIYDEIFQIILWISYLPDPKKFCVFIFQTWANNNETQKLDSFNP